MHFRGKGEGKTRDLPQHRVLVLAAKARPLIAEAKAYEVNVISNGNRIVTVRDMPQLKRRYHEVRYSPRLYLPARQL